MPSKALPPIPFQALLQRFKPQPHAYDKTEAQNVLNNLWPDQVRKILARDVAGCVEEHGIECSHPQFLGVHLPKLALVFNDIRKLRGIEEKGPVCMPLNYHWLNEAMKDIKKEELEFPFLVSEVLNIELLHLKIYKNLLKDL